MAYIPKIDPVQITPIDLGEIQNNNLRSQALQLQNQDALRQQNALASYKSAIDSGQPPDQAANAIRALAPELADKLSHNALTYRTGQAALVNDMDKFIQARVPMAKDQAGWDAVLNEAAGRYGIQIPESLKTYSPEMQQQLLMGGLSAAQRIAQQEKTATAQALGLPAGVDPSSYAGAYHSILSAGQEAQLLPLRKEQMETNISNTRSEMQKRDEMYPIQKQNIESEIKARQDRRKIIMVPDTINDPGGLLGKKVPGILIPGQNGEPDSVMPLQSGQGGMGDMGGSPQGQGGQPTYGPVPQQGAAGQTGQFKTANDVKAAYKSGKINRDQAKAILQQQFGMQ